MFSKHFKIADRWIGKDEPCFVVAEVGLNHNGDVNLAESLIKVAKETCKVDAVKFQKRNIEKIFTKKGLKRSYQNYRSYGSTYGQHRKTLELSEDNYKHLKRYADKIGIIFFASAWDEESADFLETLNVPAFKIASPDVTNLPLIEHISKKDKPVIMSTGMSTMEEIEEAVETISKHNDKLILLHCLSTYPIYPKNFNQINLNVMNVLKEKFNCLVGYSSHDLSICISEVAVGLGASVIEKHLTLDRAMRGPDHAASWEPYAFYRLVRDIRDIEDAMGDGVKRIVEGEKAIREKLAKSIVANQLIRKGETITRGMITCKSPALGVKPQWISRFLGKKANRDITKDEYLFAEDIA